MKRKWLLCLLVGLLLLLGACAMDGEPMTTPESENNITTAVATSLLPVYIPGSIKLASDEEIQADESWPFYPKYRGIYYTIDGAYDALYDSSRAEEWGEVMRQKRIINGEYAEVDEMDYVTFIKYFQIEREDFENAIEKQREIQNLFGQDETSELWELPNADIIYTFDNDIINEYYRRE